MLIQKYIFAYKGSWDIEAQAFNPRNIAFLRRKNYTIFPFFICKYISQCEESEKNLSGYFFQVTTNTRDSLKEDLSYVCFSQIKFH